MKKPLLQIGNGNWGAKDGSLLGYADGDTIDQFKARPLDFERGTNLGATRVGKDGLVEKGRKNLLNFSNNFDNPIWNGQASWVGGQAGYDGTNNAWNFTKNGATNSDLYNESFSGLQTFSIYAKKEDDKGLKIVAFHTGGNKRASFNLATGEDVASASDKGVHSHAEDLNNGWWRLSFTINNTNAKWYLYTTDGTNNQIITTVTLQNAQLEYGVAPSAAIETGSSTNLFTNSNALSDSDWAKNSITLEGNQLGYDGSHNAWKFTKTAAQYKQISQAIEGSNVVRTISVYAKAGSLDHVSLFHRDNDANPVTDSGKKFDLVKGVVEAAGAAGSAISASMKDVGNGWYRCQMTYNHTGGDVVRIYADFEETVAGYIYIQNPQLEDGSSATEYSGTSNYAGLSDDSPRIDYSDTDPHLLLEPTRANKVMHSEYLGSWSTVGQGTVELGYEAPDGTKSACKVTNGDTNFALYVGGMLADDTRSIWAKTVSGTGTLDLLTYGENTDNTFSITNDWQRFELTGSPHDTGDTNIYAVDFRGAGNLNEVLLWGAQCETGAFATSYIPTYGASVTRQAEGTGQYDMQDFFDGNDFTLFVDLEENPDLDRDGSNLNIRLSESDAFSGSLRIYRSGSGDGVSVLFYPNNEQVDTAISLANATKIAIRRVESTGVFTAFTDGVSAIHVTNPYTNTNFDQMRQLRIQGGGSTMKLKGIKIYDKALTDAECIELTS